MRVLPVATLAAVAALLGAREADASCSGCCHLGTELLGWSKDGRTYIVKEQIGSSPQTVVIRDGKEIERWGGELDDFCLEGGGKPAMPVDTFARHKIDRVDAAWRERFKSDYRLVPAKKPVVVNKSKCSGTDVVVNGDGRAVASFVSQCDPQETDCIRGTIAGGYVHPSKPFMLVKNTVHACGAVSTTSFKLVRL